MQRFQPALVTRVKMYTRANPIFDEFGITAELEKALRPKVWLKSGGYIVINQTEALVAIDVNTGKFVGKSNRLEDTIVKTNTDAIKEIVRQIRLRDLGGIIVVDFIDMDERKNRQKVMQALEEAMRADRAPYKILQFNDFGLVAITRKRVKQSLERTLCTPCPYCEGAGYVKSPQTIVGEILQEAHKIAGAVEGKDVMLRVGSRSGQAAEIQPEHLPAGVGGDSGPDGDRQERSRNCTRRSSIWHRARCGARTLACRVETLLDTCSRKGSQASAGVPTRHARARAPRRRSGFSMLRIVATLLCTSSLLPAQYHPANAPWNRPVAPFRIVGNLYYVGASGVSAFLFTTPQGHVLLDAGFRETAPMIEANLKKLGFRMEDIKLLVASHAHYDHAGGLAAIKARTKARFLRAPPMLRCLQPAAAGISSWETDTRSRPCDPMDCSATASQCNWAGWF